MIFDRLRNLRGSRVKTWRDREKPRRSPTRATMFSFDSSAGVRNSKQTILRRVAGLFCWRPVGEDVVTHLGGIRNRSAEEKAELRDRMLEPTLLMVSLVDLLTVSRMLDLLT
jgi:hypothetical protein